MDGILNINKPAGLTSFDVVTRIRKILRIKKAGHGGTLDPQVTGVLLILLGNATKIFPYLVKEEKEYEAEMVLGIVTDTHDGEGRILKENVIPDISEDKIKGIFKKFLGKREQIPPMASAKRYHGKRLYNLYRQGIYVDRKPQKIEIKQLVLLSFLPPRLKFKVVCSSGTYVRVLCYDLGKEVGCGAYMSGLVRKRVGNFRLDDAIPLNRPDLFIENIKPVNPAQILHTKI